MGFGASIGRARRSAFRSWLRSLAIWGHDWLHRAFVVLFWISVPLFAILTLGIVSGHAGGTQSSGGFGWVAFLTQMATAASFNVTAAPYVSDYSRYLPARTPRALVIAHVFLGPLCRRSGSSPWGPGSPPIWARATP